MRMAWITVQMVVDILRTHVRLYRPVAMSESMASDRHSENMNLVRCGTPDQRPIYIERYKNKTNIFNLILRTLISSNQRNPI